MRDREKFLRAREFLEHLGCGDPDSIAALEAFRQDTDSEKWKARWEKLLKQNAEFEKKHPAVRGKEEALRLAGIGTDSAKLLASMIDPELELTGTGPIWMLEEALRGERFLDEPERIQLVRATSPDSAWGAMLEIRRALEEKDWGSASRAVSEVLSKRLEPMNLGTRDALTEFLMADRGYSYTEASKGRAHGMVDVDAPDFLSALARDFYAEALLRVQSEDPSWVKVAIQGMALAEFASESNDAGHVEAGLALQRNFLAQLGRERAQNVLQIPYEVAVAEIEREYEDASRLGRDVAALTMTLSPEEQLRFAQLRRTLGDSAAMVQMKPR
jgi:hypothetical protein